jgi:hypothetical protein
MSAASAVPRPSLLQSLFEFRALFEMMSLAPAQPMLKAAPRGDGHPVLVFPGFFASDGSTARLRKYLDSKGFTAYAWEQGRNPGISDDLYQRLEARLLELAETYDFDYVVIDRTRIDPWGRKPHISWVREYPNYTENNGSFAVYRVPR